MRLVHHVTALAVLSLGAVSCRSDAMNSASVASPIAALAASPPADDDGIAMRTALRELADSTFERQITESRNIVIIGFRPEGSPWGVNEKGISLVSPERIQEYRAVAASVARRVIYEFHHIPAVGVELPAATVALQLRRLPWVDYVVPNMPELTPDQAEGGSGTGCTALEPPQTVPWNITKVGADQAWTFATGTNGSILVLDDGLDYSQAGPNGYGYQEIPTSAAYGYLENPGSPDDGAHGTLVSSVAITRNNAFGIVGVAPGATHDVGDIYPELNLAWQNAAAQIIDMARAGTKVITISSSSKGTSLPPGFTAFFDAIRNAYNQRGILFTASTGNQSSSTIQSYPARWDEVIGVGGSGQRATLKSPRRQLRWVSSARARGPLARQTERPSVHLWSLEPRCCCGRGFPRFRTIRSAGVCATRRLRWPIL